VQELTKETSRLTGVAGLVVGQPFDTSKWELHREYLEFELITIFQSRYGFSPRSMHIVILQRSELSVRPSFNFGVHIQELSGDCCVYSGYRK
jgi:hypothetical protein